MNNHPQKVDYLRVSVTKRCNLNCIYCRPLLSFKQFSSSDEVLSPEKIKLIVKVFSRMGINRVRITGGEPLEREDILPIVEKLKEVGLKELTMTTNGVKLLKFASYLKKAGLQRINVSLDSLKKDKFCRITGKDALFQVLRGIEEAEKVGLSPIKVNFVVLKGINEDEIIDFVDFSRRFSVIPRFIEYMSYGEGGGDWYVSNSSVRARIEKKWGPLTPTIFSPGSGPARYYKIAGFSLPVGFISPVSEPFCSSCSRLRLTADGKLFPCLFSMRGVDVGRLLKEKTSTRVSEEIETRLKSLFRLVLRYKKEENLSERCKNRFMFQMGG